MKVNRWESSSARREGGGAPARGGEGRWESRKCEAGRRARRRGSEEGDFVAIWMHARLQPKFNQVSADRRDAPARGVSSRGRSRASARREGGGAPARGG